MATNSRAKGKRGELEARDFVRRWWHAPECIRAAQANGSFSADLLRALPKAHVEVKRRRNIAATKYIGQAIDDKEDDEFPVVLMREDHGSWVVMFPIEETESFVRAYLKNKQAYGSTSRRDLASSGDIAERRGSK